MAQPIFLPEPQFETFGAIQLAYSRSISLGEASFSGGQIVVSRINVENSGVDVDRAGVGVIKAVAWDYGWLVLKANGVVVAFDSTGEPNLRNDLPSNFLSNVADIAADGGYAVVVKTDGTLAEWRASLSLPAATLPSGSGFVRVSVSAGPYLLGLAVKENGTVVYWQAASGANVFGSPNVSSLTSIANVSASFRLFGGIYLHWIAITRDGAVIYNGNLLSGLSRIVNGFVGVAGYYLIDDSGKIFSNDKVNYGAGIADWESYTEVVSGEMVNSTPHFLRSNGDVVNIYGSVILTDIDRMYRGGGFVRLDGSLPLYDGMYRHVPQALRLAVNSLGDNDFSFVYDGNVKNITPNYERPLGREVVSATISPETPRNVGTYGITYSISDISYKIATADATGVLTITPGAPIITKAQVLSGSVGMAFSRTPALTDAANRSATSWAAIGLPAWAQIDASTGQITGTPQDVDTHTITLTATGPGGTDTETATIVVALGAPIITAGQSFTGKVGEAFSAQLSLEDALDRPATSWSATGLPAWLSLNTETGVIAGTPATKGSFTAKFMATGGGGTSVAQSVAFTISEGVPIITAGQALSGTVGMAFSRTPALTDAANRPATSWAAIGLPAWAQINASTGQITGTPSEKNNDTFLVQATGPGGVALEEVVLKITEFIGLEGSFFGFVEVVADLQAINKISAAFLAHAEIESYLYGADSFLPVNFNSYGELSVGGSFDFYGDVFLQFSEGSGFVGNLRLLALTRFAYGELYLAPFFSGKAEIYYYTTLNGKITPEPLVKLGIKFSLAQKLEYREEFIAPREFDYVPIASGGFVQGEINIPSSARYGIYNLWATKDLPPGDAAVHLAINLVKA